MDEHMHSMVRWLGRGSVCLGGTVVGHPVIGLLLALVVSVILWAAKLVANPDHISTWLIQASRIPGAYDTFMRSWRRKTKK
jgi:hypothetical protein